MCIIWTVIFCDPFISRRHAEDAMEDFVKQLEQEYRMRSRLPFHFRTQACSSIADVILRCDLPYRCFRVTNELSVGTTMEIEVQAINRDQLMVYYVVRRHHTVSSN